MGSCKQNLGLKVCSQQPWPCHVVIATISFPLFTLSVAESAPSELEDTHHLPLGWLLRAGVSFGGAGRGGAPGDQY